VWSRDELVMGVCARVCVCACGSGSASTVSCVKFVELQPQNLLLTFDVPTLKFTSLKDLGTVRRADAGFDGLSNSKAEISTTMRRAQPRFQTALPPVGCQPPSTFTVPHAAMSLTGIHDCAHAETYDNVESARFPADIATATISGYTFIATANTGLETSLITAYGVNLNEIDPSTVSPANPWPLACTGRYLPRAASSGRDTESIKRPTRLGVPTSFVVYESAMKNCGGKAAVEKACCQGYTARLCGYAAG
jgi:hypothetical protein